MIVRMLPALLVLLAANSATAGLDARLADLEPFVGKTFVGEFTPPGGAGQSRDVQVWEAILGGKAVRVTHSLDDGAYGGETVIFWDPAQDAVAFHYFTTADFHTRGTMSFADGVWTARETVDGGAGGITEVESTSTILPDGRLKLESRYLKDGEWEQGHEAFYSEDPEAELVFRSAGD